VFIEKTGPNAKGVHHSIMGTAKNPDETGHAFHLAEAAKARGIITIGVGDGGLGIKLRRAGYGCPSFIYHREIPSM
jgi:hypothetical protein